MKKNILLFASVLCAACTNGPTQKDVDNLKHTIDSISNVCTKQTETIKTLRDSVEILSFPADQRLTEINSLVASDKFDAARKKISELKKVFPKSEEANACESIEASIDAKEAAAKAEAERIKALGFKALAARTSFSIDYNKVNIASVSIGSTFVHDAYDDRYFYNTADRGNKFVTAAMSITSTEKDPDIPELAVYSISGDKMVFKNTFRTEFARWRDYGAYLGNYHDNSNDFAKVSTVKFKIGVEVSDAFVSNPFAIVCMNKNVLSRSYERFNNPPVSYSGGLSSYPTTLKVEDFEKRFTLVKLYNLK